jgi:hypothetical protein
MMSLQTMRDLTAQAARRAAARHEKPAFWLRSKGALNKKLPFFGDYSPEGFDVMHPRELVIPSTVRESVVLTPICADGYLEIDSSGWGGAYEPVLLQDEFQELAKANPDIGWAIVEAGQFQAVLACYRKGA